MLRLIAHVPQLMSVSVSPGNTEKPTYGSGYVETYSASNSFNIYLKVLEDAYSLEPLLSSLFILNPFKLKNHMLPLMDSLDGKPLLLHVYASFQPSSTAVIANHCMDSNFHSNTSSHSYFKDQLQITKSSRNQKMLINKLCSLWEMVKEF